MGVGNPTIGRCLVLVEPVQSDWFCIEIRGFQAVAQTEVSPVGLEFQWAILALLAWQPTENKAERPVGKASPSGKLQMGFAFRICLTLKQPPKTTPEGTFSKVVSEPESSHTRGIFPRFAREPLFGVVLKRHQLENHPGTFPCLTVYEMGIRIRKNCWSTPEGQVFQIRVTFAPVAFVLP